MERQKKTGIISMLFLGIALILSGCGGGGGGGDSGDTGGDSVTQALSIPSVYEGKATVIYNYYDSNGDQTATTSEQVNIIIRFNEPSIEENNPFHLRIDTIPMLVQGFEEGPGLFNIESFMNTVTPYPDLTTIRWQYWSLKYNSNGFAGSLTDRCCNGIPTAIDSSTNLMSIIYFGPLANVLVDKVITPGATISAALDETSINMKINGELANIVGGTVSFTIDLQASKQEE